MADLPPGNRLLDWALGTFHAGLFVLTIVVALYRAGGLDDLLGGLNTLLGLAIYGLLWVVTEWTTRRALRGVEWRELAVRDPGELLSRGLGWGGVTGVLLLLVPAVILVIVAVPVQIAGMARMGLDRGPRILVEALQFLFVGAGALLIAFSVAFIVGAIVGAVFALVDALVLAAARFVFALRTGTRVGLSVSSRVISPDAAGPKQGTEGE
ncbi:MAG: hypothetical protein GEU73_06265 [Chloroflexi bacterium]|nr:hypothetical protein [Chloroflexota bacterium]